MKLLFFQNCISPHQMPYIEELAKFPEVDAVAVVAPRYQYGEREKMGWKGEADSAKSKAQSSRFKDQSSKFQDQSFKLVRILITTKDDEVLDIMNQFGNGSYMFFLGISAFPELFQWFKLSLQYSVKRGIITEGPFVYDKPLWMHKLRFALKDWRYVKYFDYVFAIGEDCAKYYQIWSKRWRVVPFMYATRWIDADQTLISSSVEEHTSDSSNSVSNSPMKVCFIGSLDKRKNVKQLIDAIHLLKVPMDVSIIGDGPERANLEAKSEDLNIRFLGSLQMAETQKNLATQDVLVLPSLHDGWGAVINEAMTLGVVPLCSNHCGAKYIVKQSNFGGVFPVNDAHALADMLTNCANNIEKIRESRQERIAWAKEHIAPNVVAKMLLQSL